MQRQKPNRNWDDFVDDLLRERLARSEATEFEFEDLEADVPLSFGEDATRATWRLNGRVTVTVEGDRERAKQPLAEWLNFWTRYSPDSERE